MDKQVRGFGAIAETAFWRQAVAGHPVARIIDLESQVVALERGEIQAAQLSDIADDLGDVRAGRFIAAVAGQEPTAADFTGVFVSAEGETFDGELYHIGGVNLGELEFGLSADTGKAYAASGRMIIDHTGLSLVNQTGESINPFIKFYERKTGLANDVLVGYMYGDWGQDVTDDAAVWLIAKRTDTTFNRAIVYLSAWDVVENKSYRIVVDSTGNISLLGALTTRLGLYDNGTFELTANNVELFRTITGSSNIYSQADSITLRNGSAYTAAVGMMREGYFEAKEGPAATTPGAGSGRRKLAADTDGWYDIDSSAVRTRLNPGDGAKVSISSAYSLADSTEVNMSFDTEDWDTNGLVSLGTYATRITIQRTGIYLVTANAGYATNVTGSRRLRILKNGTDVILNVIGRAANTLPTQVNNAELVSLTAGDYIQMVVWQDSGGALNVNPGRMAVQQVS